MGKLGLEKSKMKLEGNIADIVMRHSRAAKRIEGDNGLLGVRN